MPIAVPAAAQADQPALPPLRLALVAPPTQTVPPAALGGLDQVRWLADGLSARGHELTLIGAGLHGFVAERYQVIDTDAHPAARPDPDLADAWHAKTCGEVLAQLDVDAVGDHTLTGYQPAHGRVPPTAWTFYQPVPTATRRRAAAMGAAGPARSGRSVTAPAAAGDVAAMVGRDPPRHLPGRASLVGQPRRPLPVPWAACARPD